MRGKGSIYQKTRSKSRTTPSKVDRKFDINSIEADDDRETLQCEARMYHSDPQSNTEVQRINCIDSNPERHSTLKTRKKNIKYMKARNKKSNNTKLTKSPSTSRLMKKKLSSMKMGHNSTLKSRSFQFRSKYTKTSLTHRIYPEPQPSQILDKEQIPNLDCRSENNENNEDSQNMDSMSGKNLLDAIENENTNHQSEENRIIHVQPISNAKEQQMSNKTKFDENAIDCFNSSSNTPSAHNVASLSKSEVSILSPCDPVSPIPKDYCLLTTQSNASPKDFILLIDNGESNKHISSKILDKANIIDSIQRYWLKDERDASRLVEDKLHVFQDDHAHLIVNSNHFQDSNFEESNILRVYSHSDDNTPIETDALLRREDSNFDNDTEEEQRSSSDQNVNIEVSPQASDLASQSSKASKSSRLSNKSKPSESVNSVNKPEKDELPKDVDTPAKLPLRRFFLQMSHLLWRPWRYLLFYYYITPTSITRVIIDLIACIIILYNLFTVSYRAAFEKESLVAFRVVDIIFDCAYIFVMFSQFFCAHPTSNSHQLQKSRSAAVLNYMKLGFWIDLITFFPYDWVLVIPTWRLNRLVGLLRFEIYYARVEKLFSNSFPGIAKIFKLVLYLVIILHLGTCLLFTGINIEGNGRLNGSFSLPEPLGSVDHVRQLLTTSNPFSGYSSNNMKHYVVSLYFVMYWTLNSQSALPQDLIQVLIVTLFVIFGAGFIATVISTASVVVSNFNKTESQFQEKMSTLKDYFRYRKVSHKIRKDVAQYYHHLYKSGSLLDRREVIGDLLDNSIERDLAKALHIGLVDKVPLFKAVGDEFFIDDICLVLEYIYLLKGYFIIRKGEVGKEMYFIKSGTVEVVGENGEIYAQLKEGAFFGEVALTNVDNIRTASIRAFENCELFSLTKKAFDEVLALYPSALKHIKEKSMQQMNQK